MLFNLYFRVFVSTFRQERIRRSRSWSMGCRTRRERWYDAFADDSRDIDVFFVESSTGPLPQLEYDGTLGKGTFRWTGPPAIVKDVTSYEIEFAEVYPGTTVQPSALTFKSIKSVSLPHVYDVAALTMYTFKITASLTKKDSITSDYANVTTSGRGSSAQLSKFTIVVLFSRMPSDSLSRRVLSRFGCR